MIKYHATSAAIDRLVRSRQPNWHAKAARRLLEHRKMRRYINPKEVLSNGKKAKVFYGEVKSVFVTVQYGKCAYCESKPESSVIQWDVEHFRPKSNVTEWELPGPGSPDLARRHFRRKPGAARFEYRIPTGPAMSEGYYLLSYDLGNYAAACKTCNTIYKRNYFPVANDRLAHERSIAAHLKEGAYLIYPLGDRAEDPEQYITFEDVQAAAKNGSPRGQLIIDFFDLNREGIQRSRAEWLVHTCAPAFEGFVEGRPKAIKTMQWLLSSEAPFTNCTRRFVELCKSDPAEAARRYAKMERILQKAC